MPESRFLRKPLLRSKKDWSGRLRILFQFSYRWIIAVCAAAGAMKVSLPAAAYGDTQFAMEEIRKGGDIYKRINGKSYYENDDISLEELRYLTILYYDFDHEVQNGELIVHSSIAEDCLDIFEKLYKAEYEIASVKLIDEYWEGDGAASDTASVEANNTSAFCYRLTTSGKSLSNHALGCAIDINPRQNPYFEFSDGEAVWYHEGDEEYLNRDEEKEHMITEHDLCYQLFTEYGFTWGGDWTNPKDYQHFERK